MVQIEEKVERNQNLGQKATLSKENKEKRIWESRLEKITPFGLNTVYVINAN